MEKIRWGFLGSWLVVIIMVGLFWYGVYNFVVDFVL